MIFLISWQFAFNISNAAISSLINIFHKFIYTLIEFSPCEKLRGLLNRFPASYNQTLKVLDLDRRMYTVYVLCPKCNFVYDYQNCIEYHFGRKKSKVCNFVSFPNHPHRTQRIPCNVPLLSEKLSVHNELRLIPKKLYPYCPLKDAIGRLVSQPDFLRNCEHWRNRSVPSHILGDVYEGKVWNDFNSDRYDNFLKSPGNLLMALNFDYFQPFTNTQYSVGVLYLTILNLPRNQRYNIENLILVCIIPGPREPKYTLNPLLAPFVADLKSANEGWLFSINNGTGIESSVFIRACIGCVSCDIPAFRKLCGFLGHSARLGCSKCLKEFPTNHFGDAPDYSGFNRDEWTPRSIGDHRKNCEDLCSCSTKSALRHLESRYGIRYSILLDLPYFDPVRFGVIDPMHNLLLGTPKHMLSLWIEKKLLNQQDLDLIQTQCEN